MAQEAQQPTTTEPAPRPAGFWLRGLAYALDIASIALGSHTVIITCWFYSQIGEGFSLYLDPESFGYEILFYVAAAQVVATVLLPVVSAVFIASGLRATPGKLTVRIYVVDRHGGRVGFWRALAREFAKWLSLASLLIGFLIAAFTRDKAALHDMIAGTRVKRLPRRRPAEAAAPPPAAPPPATEPPAVAPVAAQPEIGRLAYVFAGLGALPVLGWPFGIGALVWGLVSRKRYARRVALIAALCTFVINGFYVFLYYVSWKPQFENQDKVMAAMIQAQITRNQLVRAACHIDIFRQRYGRLPRHLGEMVAAQRELDLWLSIEDRIAVPEDAETAPPFRYERAGKAYRLYSVGRDGEPGTKDDIQLPKGWSCPAFHPPELDKRREDET